MSWCSATDVISLVGTSVPDRSAIADALAVLGATMDTPHALDVGGDEAVELDVSGWDVDAVVEALAPVLDGRIAAPDAAKYVTQLTLVHRMAGRFDADVPGWPEDVVGLHEALSEQLRQDCEVPWVWDAWASALTQEDDAERPTVADGVLRWLGEIEAGALRRSPGAGAGAGVHHAGALHTYGYLCSSLWTKYGWKRTRWVGGGIAAAAGIAPALLQPVPPSGTLLSNATVLAGRLLGWEVPGTLTQATAVYPSARQVGRVVEVATARQTPDGIAPLDAPVEIRTSLFRRDEPPAIHAPNLLVYTVVQEGVERLVTLFDVDVTKVASLLSPLPGELGDGVGLRLRYNAWLDGIGPDLLGSRTVTAA